MTFIVNCILIKYQYCCGTKSTLHHFLGIQKEKILNNVQLQCMGNRAFKLKKDAKHSKGIMKISPFVSCTIFQVIWWEQTFHLSYLKEWPGYSLQVHATLNLNRCHHYADLLTKQTPNLVTFVANCIPIKDQCYCGTKSTQHRSGCISCWQQTQTIAMRLITMEALVVQRAPKRSQRHNERWRLE